MTKEMTMQAQTTESAGSTPLKQLRNSGIVKRVDGIRVRFDALAVEPGFNLRDEGPEIEAHTDAIADFVMQGGKLPPLEVRFVGEKAFIVDGHMRQRGYAKAIARGAEIEYVDAVVFLGNDLDRTARIISSQEGRKLTPLEVARGYKRLRAFGLSPDDIAKKVGKTPQYVSHLLILADANNDVHKLVADGSVAAAVAVAAVREHGEGAGAFLAAQLEKARGAGKRKVTPGVIEGKPLPKKVLVGVVEEMDAFVSQIPSDARQQVTQAFNVMQAGGDISTHMVQIPTQALLGLMGQYEEIEQARKRQAAKAREAKAKAGQQTFV